MGLTHFSILNSIHKDLHFSFVETNKKINLLMRNNLNVNFYSSDLKLISAFDLTLITTPPFAHCEIIESCIRRGDKTIFVEKPFGGFKNNQKLISHNSIYIGYVLRFNPIISWVKKNIKTSNVKEIEASYLSNTITKKPEGWRNGKFSGVLNEMGSHIIDLTNFLFDIKDYEVLSSKINSYISDVDDEVTAQIYSNEKKINFYFNWVDKTKRKPEFKFRLVMKNDEKVIFDQQKVTIFDKKNNSKIISVADIAEKTPYYLRGIDFSKQMLSILGDKKNLCSLEGGYLVNKIMNDIYLKNEINLRR